jgi:hypothetical protein
MLGHAGNYAIFIPTGGAHHEHNTPSKLEQAG